MGSSRFIISALPKGPFLNYLNSTGALIELNLPASIKTLRASERDGSWNLKTFSRISRYFPVISLCEPPVLDGEFNICFICAAILVSRQSFALWGSVILSRLSQENKLDNYTQCSVS